ncbi:membrane progestin receptor beta-like [Mercenaria mercenaria]|uniref:membrane progestin receptor beta-like n=1 Tax=Mercenaria mercenaria TaxID=6596 RepID=UPI00234EDE5A|nr:membrane progestin receptor beta-like [Mercenaria mercenaria]
MPTAALKELIKQTLDSIPWQTKLQPTLPAERVPYVLHEPAILSGYRVLDKDWKYYFFSLFQLHNETINVWSHLIGCIIISLKLYGYFGEFDIEKDDVMSTLLMFGISCLIGLFTSASVHLVHSKSPFVHFVAFMVDYIGATILSFGSGIAGIYGLSEARTYNYLMPLYIPVVFISSYLNFVNLCMAKIWFGHDPHNLNRKYMFIIGMGIQALINMAPFATRYETCFDDESCSMSSLNHLTLIQIVFILEAIAFAAHQPEKTWPGKFDIVGHGHQIFHVLIICNHVFQLDAVYADHKNDLLAHSKPNCLHIFVIMVALYVLEGITLYFIAKLVPKCLERVKESQTHKED